MQTDSQQSQYFGYLKNIKNVASMIFATPENDSGAVPQRLELDVTALTRFLSRADGLAYIKSHLLNTHAEISDDGNFVGSFGPGTGPRIVVGARYDVSGERLGADATASGVAGLLELARVLDLKRGELRHRVDLVVFGKSGSAAHAKILKERQVDVKLVINLDSIGYFDDRPNSQRFPFPALRLIYPSSGNFIAIVGESNSTFLHRKLKNIMRKNSRIDVQALGSLSSASEIDFSVYKPYAKKGFPTVMLTDTSWLRNPNSRSDYDTPETLDYEKMSEVIDGVVAIALQF